MATTRWISGTVALLAGAAAWCILGGGARFAWCPISRAEEQQQLYQILGQFSSVSGTLLGFLIAALSILSAVVDRRLIANMRKTGHYEVLLNELFIASMAYLATLVMALVSMFTEAPYLLHASAITTSLFVFATAAMIRAGKKFYSVMIRL